MIRLMIRPRLRVLSFFLVTNLMTTTQYCREPCVSSRNCPRLRIRFWWRTSGFIHPSWRDCSRHTLDILAGVESANRWTIFGKRGTWLARSTGRQKVSPLICDSVMDANGWSRNSFYIPDVRSFYLFLVSYSQLSTPKFEQSHPIPFPCLLFPIIHS